MPKERVCGTCTACCKTHQVLSIRKISGVLCWHCEIGAGCKIYNSRPSECRDFKCQWLMGYGLDEHRPDTTKVVIDYCTLEPIDQKAVSLWEIEPGSLESEFAKKETWKMLAAGISVMHVYLNARQILYLALQKTLTQKQARALAQAKVETVPYI